MKRNENTGMLILGILLLLAGGGYLLGQVFHLNIFHLLRGWWTLFLIVPALLDMIREKPKPGNIILLAAGGLLLAKSRGWLHHIPLGMIFAVILAGAGIFLVLQAAGVVGAKSWDSRGWDNRSWGSQGSGSSGQRIEADQDSTPSYAAIFSSKRVRNDSPNLMMANCSSIFGSLEADFSDTIVPNDITIICEAVFGSIRIAAPQGCRLVLKGLPVFGSVHNHRQPAVNEHLLPAVTIDCTSVFSSVDIF